MSAGPLKAFRRFSNRTSSFHQNIVLLRGLLKASEHFCSLPGPREGPMCPPGPPIRYASGSDSIWQSHSCQVTHPKLSTVLPRSSYLHPILPFLLTYWHWQGSSLPLLHAGSIPTICCSGPEAQGSAHIQSSFHEVVTCQPPSGCSSGQWNYMSGLNHKPDN